MEYLIIGFIGFVAFFLKGITGTGTSTAIIAFCALVIDPKIAIVLASFVNIWGGFYMLRTDPLPLKISYWSIIAMFMSIGSVFGAITLKIIDGGIFNVILGSVFLIVSALFFFDFSGGGAKDPAPHRASILDSVIGWIAGFCGGFVGVNAPVLVGYFGHYLDKRHMRRLLVIIFIPAAIAQTLTFIWNGLFSVQILLYAAAMIPGMVAGVYLGNKLFHHVSDLLFKRILSVFLVFVSLKLIFG